MKQVQNASFIKDMKNFGEKLKKIRTLKQLTQSEMAQKIGLTPSSYSNWELGKRKPRLNKLKKVADVFGVPVSYLTDDKEINLSESLEDQIVNSNNEIKLPVLSGRNFANKSSEEEVFSDVRYIKFQLLNKKDEKNLFLFKVEGSSMECYGKRTLPPGTFVLCTRDFDLQEATGRPVVLSVNNGSAIIREFDVDGDSLRLTPWNNSYEIIKEKKNKVKIYGRVLKCILNFED